MADDGIGAERGPGARRRGAASGIDELEWAPRWDGEPPPEAYTTVSEPERFAALRPFVLALLDDLEAEFDVRRETPTSIAGGVAEHVPWTDVVRLVPADPRAAPLTVAFTSFPGVLVRCGDVTDEVLPACGCDACDDLIQDLADELRFQVEAVVSGGFSEWHETAGRGHRFAVPDWGLRSSFVPADDPAPATNFRHDWAPWPARRVSRASASEWMPRA
jgi:hypothetical protein